MFYLLTYGKTKYIYAHKKFIGIQISYTESREWFRKNIIGGKLTRFYVPSHGQ